jgi:hypothetical protein
MEWMGRLFVEVESDGGGRNGEVVLKEWTQQIVVLLSMNVIYKITGLAVSLTTQGATTASPHDMASWAW